MLRLPQNKLSNRSVFFKEIVIFVTLLHFVVAVFFYFFGFQQYHAQRFSVRTQSQLSSTIVFMPLQKYVDPAMNKHKKKGNAKKHQSHKVLDYQSYLQKQGYNVVSGKAEKIVKKAKKKTKPKTALKKQKVKKKTAQKKTASPQKKKVQKKTVAKKKVVKKTTQKVVKKQVEKKKPIAKKIADQKTKIKKETDKKQVAKEEKKNAKKENSVIAEAVKPEKVISQKAAPAGDAEPIDLEDVTFVGYRELDKLQLQSKIQQAVEMYWTPPAGMPQSTVCELKITIEKNGTVSGAKVIKTSRIRVFDIAARAAIYKARFPQDVWGKQIMVELGI